MTPAAATVTTTWLRCAHAWLDGRMGHDVVLGIGADGTFTHVRERDPMAGHDSSGPAAIDSPPDGTPIEDVDGVVLPGLVNAHSHAFHRVLRGRAQPGAAPRAGSRDRGARDTFWSWRRSMYDVAARLDPDQLFAVARGVYGEMALAGITCVGEFHYLHHQPGGTPYADPNATGRALVAAADEVGIRLTLLDTLYLVGRVGASLAAPDLDPVQHRFSDGDVHRWARRVADLDETATCRVGAAVHSVRAVPPDALVAVAELGDGSVTGPGGGPRRVLHAHVAEQRAEVAEARAVHGRSPTELLGDAGLLSDRFTAVHGVWLDPGDVEVLGAAGSTVCACPTTEGDLADGVVDGAALAAAGVGLALGTDQHAAIDLFAEARALELDQRLVTGIRGHHGPAALLAAMTTDGAASLGWPESGRLAVGAPADLAVVGTDTVRLAGTRERDLATAIVYAATAADVRATMVSGRWIVRDGRHVRRDVTEDLVRAVGNPDPDPDGDPDLGPDPDLDSRQERV